MILDFGWQKYAESGKEIPISVERYWPSRSVSRKKEAGYPGRSDFSLNFIPYPIILNLFPIRFHCCHAYRSTFLSHLGPKF